MQMNCIFCFILVVVLQTLSSSLATKNEEIKHHETKSVVHKRHGSMPTKLLLKTAPLGLGIGLNGNIPKTVHHDKKKDITTESETTTNTKNGFKTVTTVTKQMKRDKHNKTRVIAQSVQSMTTNVFDPKKPETFKAGLKPKKGLFLNLFNPFGLFADQPFASLQPQCSNQKHCKKPGMYCDKMDNQCREKVKVDGRCDQAGQCETSGDKHIACVWGTCAVVKETEGSVGQFCKRSKDCGSQDIRCESQPDISRVSKVCIYKLSEGQTCGRRNLFSLFSLGGQSRDLACKKGLTCSALGFSGRKICRRTTETNEDKTIDDEDEDGEDEDYAVAIF